MDVSNSSFNPETPRKSGGGFLQKSAQRDVDAGVRMITRGDESGLVRTGGRLEFSMWKPTGGKTADGFPLDAVARFPVGRSIYLEVSGWQAGSDGDLSEDSKLEPVDHFIQLWMPIRCVQVELPALHPKGQTFDATPEPGGNHAPSPVERRQCTWEG